MNIQEIKKFMKENKITQIELAEMSKIPLQTIRKVLSGITPNPRIDTMQAIERALGINAQNEKTLPQLSDGEQKLIELFRLVPQDQQDLVLSMINGAIESLNNN
jgi:transcriptional regulator with XRE-family HTH domain